jgi:hypothetical protein
MIYLILQLYVVPLEQLEIIVVTEPAAPGAQHRAGESGRS